ncbi:T9SS C-terminal target domain-containing protein, partial [candidate division KSB1 bacterium]
ISVHNGTSWSAPVNISNTPDLGEQSVSVYRDVIDNKIHMMYYRDSYIGRDRNLCYADDYEDKYTFYNNGGIHYTIPIRVNPAELVDIVYQEVDLAPFMTDVKDHQPVPQEFALAQNYPNPFNPTTTINYSVPSGQVKLDVYNAMGQKIKTLVDKTMAAGSYEAEWDATDFSGNLVSGGVYFYKLHSDAGVQVKKMVLQK